MDSYGDPLIGAVVIVKGSASEGAVTDQNGNYKILAEKELLWYVHILV